MRSSELLDWVSPEQEQVYRSVADFAATITSDTGERDRTGTFSREAWDRCGRFGIQGLPAPAELGGGGVDVVTTMLALEALGYACPDNGLVFSINAHLWTSVIPLWKFGDVEQQKRWLPGLCSGELIGCHAITEPEAGSDAFAMSTSAREVPGGYAINGVKAFITNAPDADVLIVFARTGQQLGPFGLTAFLVEAGTPGCTVGRPMDKLGLRTSPMAEIVLDNCLVPSTAVIGRIGRGADVFQESMRWERACIMASQVGVMQRTMEACTRYARERQQFGSPIGKFASIADKIANMRIAIDAARALVLRVGRRMDRGEDATMASAVAKAFVSEAALRSQLDAVQIHGGYGYMTEFEIERGLRDAVGGTIYSGTSEIQRRIIARAIGL